MWRSVKQTQGSQAQRHHNQRPYSKTVQSDAVIDFAVQLLKAQLELHRHMERSG